MSLSFNLINKGDFIDLLYEFKRKGANFIFNRFWINSRQRVIHTWDCIDRTASDWWIIPSIRRRWNYMITGNPCVEYEDYVAEKYFKKKLNLRLLSIGSGGGTSEIKFAKHACFKEVVGIDLSEKIIAHALEKVKAENLNTLKFICSDVHTHELGTENYDAILFHSSLHHFSKLDLILKKSFQALKQSGILILHEYVGPNKFQWEKDQLYCVNKILENDIPRAYLEKRIKKNYKRHLYKPGLLRMLLADPSESVRSSEILSVVRKYFTPVEEKYLGGNILHPLLKDISHNFINAYGETKLILDKLIEKEDAFLTKTGRSNFIFGVYKKQNPESDEN